MLGSFNPQVFTLVRNPHYWQQGKPYGWTLLKFPAYTGNDSAQLAAVNGDLDWAGLLIPDAQVVDLRRQETQITTSGSRMSALP